MCRRRQVKCRNDGLQLLRSAVSVISCPQQQQQPMPIALGHAAGVCATCLTVRPYHALFFAFHTVFRFITELQVSIIVAW